MTHFPIYVVSHSEASYKLINIINLVVTIKNRDPLKLGADYVILRPKSFLISILNPTGCKYKFLHLSMKL